jgi:hypothetical protein
MLNVVNIQQSSRSQVPTPRDGDRIHELLALVEELAWLADSLAWVAEGLVADGMISVTVQDVVGELEVIMESLSIEVG